MEIPKQVATVSNDTMQAAILILGIVLVVVSFSSCTAKETQIKSNEKIRMAEIQLEYDAAFKE